MTTQTSTIAKQAEAAGASPQFGVAYIALKAAAAQQPAVVTGDVVAILGPTGDTVRPVGGRPARSLRQQLAELPAEKE